MKGPLTRRECFKYLAASAGLTTVALGLSVATTTVGLVKNIDDEKNIDPNPVSPPDVNNRSDNLNDSTYDIDIQGQDFKLVGVDHSRKFAEENYYELEEIVRDCCMAVLEAGPKDLENPDVGNNAKAYFSTMIDLCHKYNKPIVTLDSLSKNAVRLENLQFFVGGTLMLYGVLTGGIGETRITDTRMARRFFLSTISKMFGGLYLAFCHNSALRAIVPGAGARTPYFFNHVIDQRNVELTERLSWLAGKLQQDDFKEGNYVMVNFGNGHTDGVKYYSEHPIIRMIKKGIYFGTYNLVDSNEIFKYTPSESGWERIRLVG